MAEPVPNVFEAIKDREAPEEKTIGMQAADDERRNEASPAIVSDADLGAEQIIAEQDTRAPIGKDAGAAEHTGSEAAANRGGWDGGAEDQAEAMDSQNVDLQRHADRPVGGVRR
jgi:hypothetical protein